MDDDDENAVNDYDVETIFFDENQLVGDEVRNLLAERVAHLNVSMKMKQNM